MQSIEQTIIELGDIFTQLATMVRQQEELVDRYVAQRRRLTGNERFFFRIDANVNDAAHHIEGAHTELLKYLRSVTSNRWLIIKVFAVLIIFFLIFIVFLA